MSGTLIDDDNSAAAGATSRRDSWRTRGVIAAVSVVAGGIVGFGIALAARPGPDVPPVPEATTVSCAQWSVMSLDQKDLVLRELRTEVTSAKVDVECGLSDAPDPLVTDVLSR